MTSLTAFLDASVILSGLGSPHGGSGILFTASERHKITLIATPMVIGEVYRHLSKLKLQPEQLEILLTQKIIKLTKNPDKKTIDKCLKLTLDPNDAHVLAGAIRSGSGYLLSLDQKHILTQKIKNHLSPIQVLSPKQFWQSLS